MSGAIGTKAVDTLCPWKIELAVDYYQRQVGLKTHFFLWKSLATQCILLKILQLCRSSKMKPVYSARNNSSRSYRWWSTKYSGGTVGSGMKNLLPRAFSTRSMDSGKFLINVVILAHRSAPTWPFFAMYCTISPFSVLGALFHKTVEWSSMLLKGFSA